MKTKIYKDKIKNEAAKKIQCWYIRKRHNQLIKDYLGVDIKSASNKNYDNQINALKNGTKYLESKISSTCKNQKLPKSETGYYSKSKLLTPEEYKLFDKLVSLLTLKHATPCIESVIESKELLSLKETERRDLEVKSRHTYKKYGVDDDIYFVMGIGDHRIPSFLNDYNKLDIIKIDMLEMAKTDKNTLDNFWVSGHLTDYLKGTQSKIIQFGDATYQYIHNSETRTKNYKIKRKDGTVFSWTISMDDEVFAGSKALKSIPYQFILMLRFLGYDNPFVKKIFKSVSDNKSSLEVQEKILSKTMTLMFPGWVALEAKIIAKLDINKSYISISKLDNERNITWLEKLERAFTLDEAVSDSDINEVKYLLQSGLSPDERSSCDEKTPLMTSIACNNHKITKLLLDKGADATLCAKRWDNINALFEAIEQKNLNLVKYLLAHNYTDKQEKLISYKLDVNAKGGDYRTLFGHAIYHDVKGDIINELLKHDVDFLTHGNYYLNLAIGINNNKAIVLLVEAGVKLDIEEQWNDSPLVSAIKSGIKELVDYLLLKGANPNSYYQHRVFSSLFGKYFYESKYNGNTPLHFAIQKKNIDMVESLIKFGANPYQENDMGISPIQLSNRYSKDIFDLLTKVDKNKFKDNIIDKKTNNNFNKEKIKSKFKLENSRFNVACIVNGIDVNGSPYTLLGCKRDPKTGKASGNYMFPGGLKDFSDASLLDSAIRELKEETGVDLEDLIQQKKINPVQIASPSFYSYHDNGSYYKKTVFILFNVGKHLNKKRFFLPNDDLVRLKKVKFSEIQYDKSKPLVEQYSFGKSNYIRPSNGIIISALMDGKTSMTKEEKIQIVKCYKIEDYGYSLLSDAAKDNNLKKIQFLIDNKVALKDPTYMMNTTNPMFWMIKHKNYKGIKMLLDYGFKLHQTTDSELNTAIEQEDLKMIEFLIKNGANVNDKWLTPNPIYKAVLKGNTSIVDLLVKYGADVNFCNDYYGEEKLDYGSTIKRSPLIAAIKKNDLKMVKHLIEKCGANINRQRTPFKLNTPLMTAIRYEFLNIAKYLLSTNLNKLSLKNKNKQKAYDLAIKSANCDTNNGFLKLAGDILSIEKQNYISMQYLLKSKYDINIDNMIWSKDSSNKDTIHFIFNDKKNAELLVEIVKGTLRQSKDGSYFVRIGKYRLKTLFGKSRSLASYFYNATANNPFWNIIPKDCLNDLVSIYNDEIKDYIYRVKIHSKLLDKNPAHIKHIFAQNRSLKSICIRSDKKVTSKEFNNFVLIAQSSTEIDNLIIDCSFEDPRYALSEIINILITYKNIKKLNFTSLGNNDILDLLKFITKVNAVEPKIELDSLEVNAKHLNEISLQKITLHIINNAITLPLNLNNVSQDTNNNIIKNIDNNKMLTYYSTTKKTENNLDKHESFRETLSSIIKEDTNQIFLTTRYDYSNMQNITQFKKIMDALSKNNSIQSLKIYNPSFYGDFIPYLSCTLEKNTNICDFSLESDKLNDSNITNVCDSILKREVELNNLNIIGKKLGVNSMESICKLLESDKLKVKNLNIQYNNFTDSELMLLADSIKKNKYLKILNIKNNNFSEDGLKYFSNCLKDNNHITILRFDSWILENRKDVIEDIQSKLNSNRANELNKRFRDTSDYCLFQRLKKKVRL